MQRPQPLRPQIPQLKSSSPATRKRDIVRLVNAVDGRKFISRERADRFVRRGAADWTDTTRSAIQFSDRAVNSAERSRNLPNVTDDPVAVCAAKGLSRMERSRRERLGSVVGSHTDSEWDELVSRYGNRCLRCGASGEVVKLTMDHIDPVGFGGTDGIFNLQPLCLPCNVWKGSRYIDFRTTSSLLDS